MTTKSLRLGVVQLAIEDTLAGNRDKIVGFIHRAKAEGCRLVVFPEAALYWPAETPREEVESAMAEISAAAKSAGIYTIYCLDYWKAEDLPKVHRLITLNPEGEVFHFYDKVWGFSHANDVPDTFEIDGVRCGVATCADRWARGVEELPAMDGAQLLIECSCNWLREWVSDLDHLWCAPRARRTNSYVVFSNTTRTPRGLPGHGHTSVIAPDGSTIITAGDDPDRLIVTTLDMSLATGAAAAERREHPLFRRFWQIGVDLMKGRAVDLPAEVLEHTPLTSPEVRLKVAAAQMACSRSLERNVAHAVELIRQAAAERADVIVFPELALTGALDEDILAADERSLGAALVAIQDAARAAGICVAIGLPWIEDGQRFNCAVVIGPDGGLLTRYAQIVVDRPQLFAPGTSTRAMWCEIRGAPTVVTVGRDALWSELAELAACRGAQVHLHLAYDRDVSPGASRRRKQLWVNLSRYRTLTVTVNAASGAQLPDASAPAAGGSIIWEDFWREPHLTARRAGHGPWSAYRLAEAADGEEVLYATQTVLPVNPHFALLTTRCTPTLRPWYALGAQAIYAELPSPQPSPRGRRRADAERRSVLVGATP